MNWLVAEGVEDEEEGEDDGDEGEVDGVAQAAFEAQVEQGKVADFAADALVRYLNEAFRVAGRRYHGIEQCLAVSCHHLALGGWGGACGVYVERAEIVVEHKRPCIDRSCFTALARLGDGSHRTLLQQSHHTSVDHSVFNQCL